MGEPALVCRMKGEWISMKKFKIKTNLVSGIIMGVIALILILCIPSQIRVPAYDSGAPSPRIIPGICLAIMLVSSIALLIQSLVLKQEKVVEFDWEKEKPAILLIVGMCGFHHCLSAGTVLCGRTQARSLHRGPDLGVRHLPAFQERL